MPAWFIKDFDAWPRFIFGRAAELRHHRAVRDASAQGWLRELLFAGLNVAGVFFFLFYGGKEHYVLRFVIYLALIGGLYVVMRMFSGRRGNWPWLAFFAPIVALIAVRYVPGEWYVGLGHALGKTWRGVPNMIGISYLAFRCSRLVLEI